MPSTPPSLAHQTDADLAGPWSILVRQKRDHQRLDRLLDDLQASPPVGDRHDRALHRVARLVFPHAFAEQSVVWPAARRFLPDGEALTLRVEEEHQEVNELWTLLEHGTDVATRRATVTRLATVLRQDVRDEEDALLPRLQEELTPLALRALGVAWEAVRRTAPTRPHPVVARRPPGNALAALPLTVLDRGRDALETAGRRTSARTAVRLQQADRLLAAAAGRVERFAPLRQGDRASTHRSGG